MLNPCKGVFYLNLSLLGVSSVIHFRNPPHTWSMNSLLKFNNLLCSRENRCSNVLGGSGHKLLSEALEQRRHAPASPDLWSVYINCSINIAACVHSLNVLKFLVMLQIALWTTLCFNKVGLHWSYSGSCIMFYMFLINVVGVVILVCSNYIYPCQSTP